MRTIPSMLTIAMLTPAAVVLLAPPASGTVDRHFLDVEGSGAIHLPTGMCLGYYELVAVDVADPAPGSGHPALTTIAVPGADVWTC
jgi:hypothetical protein